jgi:hypothetical protein
MAFFTRIALRAPNWGMDDCTGVVQSLICCGLFKRPIANTRRNYIAAGHCYSLTWVEFS